MNTKIPEGSGRCKGSAIFVVTCIIFCFNVILYYKIQGKVFAKVLIQLHIYIYIDFVITVKLRNVPFFVYMSFVVLMSCVTDSSLLYILITLAIK